MPFELFSTLLSSTTTRYAAPEMMVEMLIPVLPKLVA